MSARPTDDIVAVTVYCDECGREHTGDYKVAAGQDSIATARNWVATKEGWQITLGGDLCPDCIPTENNTTMSPVVPDPGEAKSYDGFPG